MHTYIIMSTHTQLAQHPPPQRYTFLYTPTHTLSHTHTTHTQQAADFNFLYGVHYAWNLVLFNLVMSFSLTTPVITPLGEWAGHMTPWVSGWDQ